MNKISFFGLFFALTFLFSCSTKQIQLESELKVSSDTDTFYVLDEEVNIKATHAKPATLNVGTRWKQVGSIKQGIVYRTKDQVVIVNSFNVHEGYIVIDQNNIVGYYLPIEKSFVEVIPTPIKLSK